MSNNIILEDLLGAVGPFMAAGLNALPTSTRRMVAEACESGGWCEVRVGVMNEAATARVVLCNTDGQALELVKLDHLPH